MQGKDGITIFTAHNPKVVSSNLTPATNFVINKAGIQDSGLFSCSTCKSPHVARIQSPIVIVRFWSASAANSADSQRLLGCVQNPISGFGKEVGVDSRWPPL